MVLTNMEAQISSLNSKNHVEDLLNSLGLQRGISIKLDHQTGNLINLPHSLDHLISQDLQIALRIIRFLKIDQWINTVLQAWARLMLLGPLENSLSRWDLEVLKSRQTEVLRVALDSWETARHLIRWNPGNLRSRGR